MKLYTERLVFQGIIAIACHKETTYLDIYKYIDGMRC